jgi:transposase
MKRIENWQDAALKLALTKVMSWRDIAKQIDVPRSTVSDFLRKYQDVMEVELVGEEVEIKPYTVVKQKYDNSRILFISDMHIPYHHPKLIEFLKYLKAKYNPTRIILLGDELDKHAMSFHDSDPDLPSAGDELIRSLPTIKEVKDLFPIADVIDSNHGSLAYRKAKHHGIPRHYIRSYNEVLQIDDGWTWHNDLVIDMSPWNKPDVYVHHGKSKQAVKTSQAMSMSHVCGHYHESFGIEYWANPKGLYFGMNAGCLIDDDQLAFAYNNANLKRPIIGTGLIIEGVPVLEAMEL